MRFLASAAVLLFTLPGYARHVSVSGKCELKVAPDRGSVQLLTEHTSKTVKDAVDEVTKQIDAAREAVKKMNLKDLELRTTQFQVNKQTEWENSKNVFKGYRASFGLEVTTSEITRLGDVMAKASAIGLNNTNNYRTFLSLEKSQDEYLKCLDIASADAKKKAERLAKKLDASLGEIESITEGSAYVEAPQPMMMMEAMSLKSADAPGAAPTIDVGTQGFNTTVRYVFKLK